MAKLHFQSCNFWPLLQGRFGRDSYSRAAVQQMAATIQRLMTVLFWGKVRLLFRGLTFTGKQTLCAESETCNKHDTSRRKVVSRDANAQPHIQTQETSQCDVWLCISTCTYWQPHIWPLQSRLFSQPCQVMPGRGLNGMVTQTLPRQQGAHINYPGRNSVDADAVAGIVNGG